MIDRINNIIDELTGSEINLSSSLLKVQVLAHKLKNEKLKEWVNYELNGYDDKNINVPAYRVIPTIVKGHLIQGHMKYTNLQLSVNGIKEKYNIDLSVFEILKSASSLESMLGKKDNFIAPVPVGLYNAISDNYDSYTSVFSAWRVVSLNNIVSVLSSIKSNLLQFMLDIADEIGEGDNVDIVKKENVINDLFNKNLGSGNIFNINTGSDIVQTTISGDNSKANIGKGDNINQEINTDDIERVKKLIGCIKEDITRATINSDDLEDLKLQIRSIKAQLERDKPKSIVLKSAFDVIKGIVSGVGTHILTDSTMIQLEHVGRVFGI